MTDPVQRGHSTPLSSCRVPFAVSTPRRGSTPACTRRNPSSCTSNEAQWQSVCRCQARWSTNTHSCWIEVKGMRTAVMADGGGARGLVTHTMAGCHLLWYNPHPHAGCLNERAAFLSIILEQFIYLAQVALAPATTQAGDWCLQEQGSQLRTWSMEYMAEELCRTGLNSISSDRRNASTVASHDGTASDCWQLLGNC